ncbi:hypothetical protein PAMP_016732 [Pampus punctatissimus]
MVLIGAAIKSVLRYLNKTRGCIEPAKGPQEPFHGPLKDLWRHCPGQLEPLHGHLVLLKNFKHLWDPLKDHLSLHADMLSLKELCYFSLTPG